MIACVGPTLNVSPFAVTGVGLAAASSVAKAIVVPGPTMLELPSVKVLPFATTLVEDPDGGTDMN